MNPERPLQAKREETSRAGERLGGYEILREIARRHHVAVAAATLAAVALIGGMAVAISQARIANVERAKAVGRFNHARQLARSVLFDYHDQIAMLPGSTEARRRLVQDALTYLDRLAAEAAGDPDLLREIADGYERVALAQAGAFQLTGGATSAANLGDTAGAEASHAKAVAIREQLATSGNPTDRLALAKAYVAFGGLYVFSGTPEKAAQHLQSATAILESFLAPGPASQEVRFLLSSSYLGLAKVYGGDTRSALSYTRSALKLQQELTAESPENVAYKQGLAAAHQALSLIYSAMGEREEELEHNRKALELARTIVAAHPDNALSRQLAVQLGNTGSTLAALKDTPRALEYFREAISIFDALVAADPNDTELRRQWAFTYLAKSRVELESDPEAAMASAQQGIRIGEEVAAAAPANVAAQTTFAQLLTSLGAAQAKAERWTDAKSAYAKALTIYAKLKAAGKLTGADAKKPDELTAEIASCEAVISARQASAR